MAFMFFEGFRVDQKVVQIDNKEIVEEVSKLVVREVLKCPWGVT